MRHCRSDFAQALSALALLAIAVRALVPAGYMLAPAQDGRFIAVQLCSEHGASEAVIDLNTGRLVDPDDIPADNAPEKAPGADAPCVFATAAALGLAEPPPALPVAFSVTAEGHPLFFSTAPGRGLAAPPPWSTGPPSTL